MTETKHLNVALPVGLIRRIKALSEKSGVKLYVLITQLLEYALEAREKAA